MMRILLTGASSFTGFWFARALAEAGHTVIAPLLRPRAAYEGVRAERVRLLERVATVIDACPFGSDAFAPLTDGIDLLAHHAATVGDYRNPDFDVPAALAANTHRLRPLLARGSVPAVLLTGSVFEAAEGTGSAPAVAFSAYGLSKTFTALLVEHACREAGVRYGKFVIPNPFGPFEEPRFTAYLLHTWRAGETAVVRTPTYVRDNIHVQLLALDYVRYAEALVAGRAAPDRHPSGYVETQGAFAERVALAMRPRLGWPCALTHATQTTYREPHVRINTEPAAPDSPAFDESAAWDDLATWYRAS